MKALRQLPMHIKLLAAMLATIAAFVLIAVCLILYQANSNTRAAGLDTASLIADQIVTLRTFYTNEVVKSAQKAGVEVDYDYADHDKTIPLPVTMVKELGRKISEKRPGAYLNLYSQYPFLHRPDMSLDDFEQSALEAFEDNPGEPYYRVEPVDGRLTMRYAVADLMRAACVDCHNKHPQSRKQDWQTGDVRGAIEVGVPVDDVRSEFYRGSALQALVLLMGSCVIVGITGILTRRMTSTLQKTLASVAGASSEIAAAVDSSERIVSEQSTALTETMTTMEQLGESSRLSASQAATGADETGRSLSLAEDGAESVQQTLQAISKLKQDVSRMTHEIVALSERIDRIGEISTFVGHLANQTNLLAMNAAVEAAHAGQHGQGFAVVATEIRKLADQSTKSVSRIRDLVTDIQQATQASVLTAEEGQVVVEQATTLAEQTAEAFNRLGSSVNKAAESVQQLSLNNREQALGINQVVEAVEVLNNSARESVTSLHLTSSGLQTLDRAVIGLRNIIGAADEN